MPRLIFIFLDGVGIGKPLKSNPFYAAKTEFLPFYNFHNTMPDKTPIKAIDSLLGIDGVPQSATGQTSLYTGENIPAILNKHKGSFPDKIMRRFIKQKNIFSSLKNKNLKVKFINSYPVYSKFFTNKYVKILDNGRFFFSDEFPHIFKKRISTTSCMMISNGLIPFDEKDIINERSIYQDFTNCSLIKKGLNVPAFTSEKAAEIIYNSSKGFDFVLYEYFQTDIYGHRHSINDCIYLLKKLNKLIGKLITLLDENRDTLLITSDHGNIEDCSNRTHTLNPVPLIVWGNKSDKLRNRIKSLVDVTPAIEEFFEIN
jgi:hypothetical protein